MEVKKFDLQERLIDFSIAIIEITESLHSTFAAKQVGGQVLRSGTSPAFNYGEAQSAESPADFVHKMKICLKELRETHIGLKIITRKPLTNNLGIVNKSIVENNELISIFVKCIQTANKNRQK
jgi:four helix bundle protein